MLNMSQQCACVVKMVNGILGCIRSRADSSLYLVLVRMHLKYFVQFWVSQYKKNMDILKRVCQRANKMMKGLEHLSYDEFYISWEIWGFSSWKIGGLGESHQCLNLIPWSEGIKRAMLFSVDKKQWAQAETQDVLSKHQEAIFNWAWQNTGTGCPGRKKCQKREYILKHQNPNPMTSLNKALVNSKICNFGHRMLPALF